MTFSRRAIPSLGVAIVCSFASPAPATSFITTELRDLAQRASAIIQGEMLRTATLADADGVPWTIYTVRVEAMLAGEFRGNEFSFRCIGGTIGDDGVGLVGAPDFEVGDSLVFLYSGGDGLCQVTGLEHGVFWRRRNAAGQERIVNSQGRALAGLDATGPVLSAEKITSPVLGNRIDVVASLDVTASLPADASKLPPAAEASVILDELVSFTSTYATRAREVVSTTDLVGVPKLVSQGKRSGK